MKVSDFEVDFSSGLFTCCLDDVMNDHSPAKEGMVIECAECQQEMILSRGRDGKLKWRAR